MGQMIEANCSYGFSAPYLPIGGGRMDFVTVCSHPALCQSGRHLVTVNLKAPKPLCPDGNDGSPIPYVSGLLTGVEGVKEVASWEGFVLTNGTHLCPACGEHKLRFAELMIRFD